MIFEGKFYQKRPGHTLIEMIVAMTSATVLMAGLGGAVLVTTRAFRPENTAVYARSNTAQAENVLLADLQLATGFTERTASSATFTVPDRDGDQVLETLRYAWSGTSGDPLTFSFNGSKPVPVALDVRSFALSYVVSPLAGVALPAEQTGSQIVMLVNDSTNPNSDELLRESLLMSWNFTVVKAGLNDGSASILNAASSGKAVYVPSTVDASRFSAASNIVGLAVGIVNEHPDLVDEIGFAAASSSTSGTNLNVEDNSHYITSSYPLGTVSTSYQFGSLVQLSDTPSSNLNSLATVSGKPGLATIDPSKLLYDGRKAAGRRVMIPWGNSSPALLNNNGQQITKSAIEWATGLGGLSAEIKRFGNETVFASTNGTLNIQYGSKATLTDKARLKSITAYVGGANDKVRFAIYSNKSGQPDKLLAESAIGSSTTAMAWVTLTVPPTDISPGDYWLAFTFNNSSQRYRYNSSGAGERNKSNSTAIANGYLQSWGTSTNSYTGTRSIYATYEVLP